MYLDRWRASFCNVVQTSLVSPPRCFGSTCFVFTLTRVALLFASSTPIAPLPLVSLVLFELRLFSSNEVRFMSRYAPFHSLRSHLGSRRVGRFIQLVRSFRSRALTSFHFTSLHSTPSAPLVTGFDFITFFIIRHSTSQRYERSGMEWNRSNAEVKRL
jgi:hypothetical protein